MSKKFLFISLILFTPLFCFSQQGYEYFGGLILNDSTSMTYKLSLTESKGEVKGYSITDLGGLYETKSTVFGEYDNVNKELNFREVQTIYTKTPLEKDYDFCYVNTTIKNFSFEKTEKFKANFVGLFEDNSQCINGELFLSIAQDIEDKMMKVKKKIDRMKRIPDSVKQKFQPLKMMDSLNMNILRKNQTLSVFSKSKNVKLIIYDGGKEDGDKITVSVNGKVIRQGFKVSNKKEIIVLSLKEDVTSVAIKAINEGEISPNTAVVKLEDLNNNIKALSNLKTGEITTIDILKVKK
ncbi:hypothetical protein E1J38_013805 [Seonamhaeicola sediminis]|uniref:Uncharacterized protein n=1 Tax=Seonamhaeicola sediminis TaxID=2528206 RepID=A0A562YB15_9FLAO|nr:hypothetical protein [Seonamhaeicola sediminis]TWO31482.1 hypothetical protein E1J38_013805 [Seonamhaeicola sediminis]